MLKSEAAPLKDLTKALEGLSWEEPETRGSIAAQSRAQFFADTIGKKPPARLLSDDGAPSPELLAFCEKTGMPLDWVFLGDLRPAVRAVYRDHLANQPL